ncbi:acyl-CoA dehydrogenase family protein [Lysinibacillus parviboronicapiens]|uniref:acyl-CoA dehydrogenase family protein n=1 Tax=Lysinibacillus parviboronicapiens TaxID=436516 RepID=UPI000D3C6D35|nr:acyl-CoA dehydrogenase family protein [Lysinibacillus parviboronicapiens]
MAVDAEVLQALIDEKLKPLVKKIDEEAYYAEDFLYALGKAGFFASTQKDEQTTLLDELTIVQETAKVCMTTAFCLWCHLAALTYIRKTDNEQLRANILTLLESGDVLGATGLSNPMKYYAGLEKIHLSAERVEGGYVINGVLPAVSNLGENHWFGAIALNGEQEVMVFVSTDNADITLKEKIHFLGVNGSATYTCKFDNVFVADDYVVTHEASSFVDIIRPTFVLYQIPLGFGVVASSVEGIEKVKAKQNGCNEYLQIQAEELTGKLQHLQTTLKNLIQSGEVNLQAICQIRLQAVYDTLAAVQANMLHNGSAGYIAGSTPSRKLREAYFFANLTPTVRQLEKMTQILKKAE